MTITDLIYRIIDQILRPAVILLFAVAAVLFLYGVVIYVIGAQGDTAKLKRGWNAILFGLLGMAVMFSAWGLVRLFCNFFRTCEGIDVINPLLPGGSRAYPSGAGGSSDRTLVPYPSGAPRNYGTQPYGGPGEND